MCTRDCHRFPFFLDKRLKMNFYERENLGQIDLTQWSQKSFFDAQSNQSGRSALTLQNRLNCPEFVVKTERLGHL